MCWPWAQRRPESVTAQPSEPPSLQTCNSYTQYRKRSSAGQGSPGKEAVCGWEWGAISASAGLSLLGTVSPQISMPTSGTGSGTPRGGDEPLLDTPSSGGQFKCFPAGFTLQFGLIHSSPRDPSALASSSQLQSAQRGCQKGRRGFRKSMSFPLCSPGVGSGL